MVRVGVVIPFFQRTPGLLERAVQSILRQDASDVLFTIVVVDDDSPCRAAAELDDHFSSDHQLVVLSQPNSGPGVARNAGLDFLAHRPIDLVAFLDSDDYWTSDHIRSALQSLGSDADFYFDDHDREQYSDEASYFSAHGRLIEWQARKTGAYITPTGEQSFDCVKDVQSSFFLNEYPAQTSTVVYRKTPALADVRFDPAFRSLGEDLLFMLEAIGKSRKVRLRAAIGAHCGAGVSIYHSALSWDHPDAPMRFAYSLMLWSTVADRFSSDLAVRHLAADRVRGFRRGLVFIMVRSALRQKRVHRSALRLVTSRRLLSWHHIPRALLGLAVRKFRSVPLFPEH